MNEPGVFWRVAVGVSALILWLPVPALACQCAVSQADSALIEKIQASWASGYASLQVGAYAQALRQVRSTMVFVPHIRDVPSRECVAAGADNYIASATAGQTYIVHHPNDRAGAKAAAQRAWHAFLSCR